MTSDNETAPQRPGLVTAVIAFAAFAGLLTGGLALLERLTRSSISNNQAAYAMGLVAEVLPAGYTNNPAMDTITLSGTALFGSGAGLPAYRARTEGAFTAVAMTVIAPDGYVGPIKLLVGIDAGGRVVRVRAVEHRETPGLGDKIEITRDDWISLFDGRSAAGAQDWRLAKDGGAIDQITGATVTSRAVTQAVRAALDYYQANSARLTAPQ